MSFSLATFWYWCLTQVIIYNDINNPKNKNHQILVFSADVAPVLSSVLHAEFSVGPLQMLFAMESSNSLHLSISYSYSLLWII